MKLKIPETFDDYNLEQRKEYSQKLNFKFPDCIPIIIKKAKNELPDLDKQKYLVPKSMTVADLLCLIRKKINITDKQAIFIFVKNCLVPMNNTLENIYNEYHSDDNFLYIAYTTENTFG
jgi:GABA(A) receptor-associated protein